MICGLCGRGRMLSLLCLLSGLRLFYWDRLLCVRGKNVPSWDTFLLAWGIPSWIILELIPEKTPHNALPLYPAFGSYDRRHCHGGTG